MRYTTTIFFSSQNCFAIGLANRTMKQTTEQRLSHQNDNAAGHMDITLLDSFFLNYVNITASKDPDSIQTNEKGNGFP